MKATSTANTLTLKLDRVEALALEQLLGRIDGRLADTLVDSDETRGPGWYDSIADALEGSNGILRHTTISKAIDDAVTDGKLTRIHGRVEAVAI